MIFFEKSTMLLKLVSADMINRGLQLKPGLNVDPNPFIREGDCVAGGLYYCDAQDIMHWRGLGYTHLCTVEVPEDTQTVKLSHKYRSDKLILSQPYPIAEHPMWTNIEICKLVVHKDGFVLKYVKNQTDEICWLAVQQDGLALQYVQNQTDEICRLAVQKSGLILEYVQKQTEEICRLAVQQNGLALEFVRGPKAAMAVAIPHLIRLCNASNVARL